MAPTYRKRYKKRRTRKEQLQMRILMILIAVILLGSILGIIHKVKQERAQQTVSDSSWDITDKKYVDQRPELDVELLPVKNIPVRGLHLKRFVELSFITRPIRERLPSRTGIISQGWNNLTRPRQAVIS